MTQGQSIAPNQNIIMAFPGATTSQSIAPNSSQNELNTSWAYLNDLLNRQKNEANIYERSKLNQLPIYENEVKDLTSLEAQKATDPEYQRLLVEYNKNKDAWNATHGPVMGGAFEYTDFGVQRYQSELAAAKRELESNLKIMNTSTDPSTYNQAEGKYQDAKAQYEKLAKLPSSEIASTYKDEIKNGYNKGRTYANGWGEGGWQGWGEDYKSSGGMSQIAANQAFLKSQDNQSNLAAMVGRIAGSGQSLTQDQIGDYINSIKNTSNYASILNQYGGTPKEGLTVPIPDSLIKQLSKSTLMPSSQADLLKGWSPTLAFPEVSGKENAIKKILDNPSQYTNRQVLEAQNDYRKLTENNIRLASSLHHFEKTEGEKYNIPMFNPFDRMGDIALQNQRIIAGVETGANKYQLPTLANYTNQQKGNQQEFLRQFNLPSGSSSADVVAAFAKNPSMIVNSPYGSPEKTNLIFQGYFPSNPSQAADNLPNVKLSNWYQENIGQNPSNLNQPFKIANEGIIGGTLDVLSEANAKRPFLSISQNLVSPSLSSIPGIMGLTNTLTNENETQKKGNNLFSFVPGILGATLGLVGSVKNTRPGSTTQTIAETPEIKAELPKFDDYYNTKKNQYEADVKAYTDAGSSDLNMYNKLKGEEKEMKSLNDIMTGVGMFRNEIANLKAAESANQTQEEPLSTVQINAKDWSLSNPFPISIHPAGVISDFTKAYGKLRTGDILGGLGQYQQGTSRFSTREFLPPISGVPEYIESQTANDTENPVRNAVIGGSAFLQSIYQNTREKPIEDIGLYFLPGGMKLADYEIESGIAGLAKSKGPIASGIGKILSLNPAQDAYTLAKIGLGTTYVASSGAHIAGYNFDPFAPITGGNNGQIIKEMDNPDRTAKGYGKRTGDVGYELGFMTLGTKGMMPTFPGIDNPAKPSEFSTLEKARQTLSAKLNSYSIPKEQEGAREAYTQIPKVYREIRAQRPQPGITTTSPAKPFEAPDISQISAIGTARAPAIRAVMAEEPHVILGSAVMEGQRTGLPTGELIRTSPHDLDMRVNSEENFDKLLATHGETRAGMDIKPFEEGYIDIPGRTNAGSNEGVKILSLGTRLFGEPIQNAPGAKLPRMGEVLIGGKDYAGVGNQELMNVQFARKGQAFMQDMIPAEKKVGNPEARGLNEQFRLPKDYYDFQSIGRDLVGGNQVAEGKPVSPTKATTALNGMEKAKWQFNFEPFEDNKIIGAKAGQTYNKKLSFGDIKDLYEKSIKSERTARRGGRTTGMKEVEYTTEPERPSQRGMVQSASSASQLVSPMTIFSSSGIIKNLEKSVSSRSPSTGIFGYSSLSPRPSPSPSPKPYISSSPSPRPSSPNPYISSPNSPISPPSSPPSYGGSGRSSFSSSSFIYNPPSYFVSYTSSPPSSFSFKGGSIFGAPFLAPPGAGGGSGKGRGGFDIVVQNPLQRLIVAKESTANRFNQVFSGKIISQNKNLFPQKKANVNPIIGGFKMPQMMKQNYIKPQTQKQSKPAYNMIDMEFFSPSKKKKGGLVF